MSEDFWLVWRPDGLPPKYRHQYQFEAEQEARRLAMKHPGKEFFVLRATALFKSVEPVERTELMERF